jgi:uncharacterized membrane protein
MIENIEWLAIGLVCVIYVLILAISVEDAEEEEDNNNQQK